MCPRCDGDCGMSNCRTCGGCENTGEQPCPDCQPESGGPLWDPYDYEEWDL